MWEFVSAVAGLAVKVAAAACFIAAFPAAVTVAGYLIR